MFFSSFVKYMLIFLSALRIVIALRSKNIFKMLFYFLSVTKIVSIQG